MKKSILLFLIWFLALSAQAGTNLQVFYDFGSLGTLCPNQRSNRVTTTVELFYPDNWGNTFAFMDIDYSLRSELDPRNTPFMAYWEIARCLNFWQNSVVKDLSLQVEYDGGLGVGRQGDGSLFGYGINHAALVGLNYCLHTADYKNIFNFELLFKYVADDENMWRVKRDGKWIRQTGNQVPLQFTFVWTCLDFCKAPGLTFSGFADIWGVRQNAKQSFVFISEPQLWYCVGQWFKCPNLHVGTEIEFSYNFTGSGFMCNPCLGIKWCFD